MSHDPSEIILIYSDAAKETFLIIIGVETVIHFMQDYLYYLIKDYLMNETEFQTNLGYTLY